MTTASPIIECDICYKNITITESAIRYFLSLLSDDEHIIMDEQFNIDIIKRSSFDKSLTFIPLYHKIYNGSGLLVPTSLTQNPVTIDYTTTLKVSL